MENEEKAGKRDKNRIRILLIDDEEDMLESCTRILSHWQYECYSASSGRMGIAYFINYRPDIVISDLRMPDIDGIGLLKECLSIDSKAIVILLTAYATVENAVEAMKIGASDYLQKPFTAEQLNNVIQRQIQLRGLLPPTMRPDVKEEEIPPIIGKSAAIQNVIQTVAQVSRTDVNVLITGKSGTGKELIAKRIHQSGTRSQKPFVPVDCACLSEDLLESELFGHVKGSFTSASTDKAGLFEIAHQGTMFLDELSHLSLRSQGKFLRVLQERQFRPVGGKKLIDVDVRILSATNRDLECDVRDGAFREDLYFRLNVIAIHLPTLQQRKEDIPLLIDHFLRKFTKNSDPCEISLEEDALELLTKYDWPGNIRELGNVIQRCLALLKDNVIRAEALPDAFHVKKSKVHHSENHRLTDAIHSAEREQIIRTLHLYGGERTKAANHLGISRKSLWEKIKNYRISSEEIELFHQ
ncbi:MAG: sigma-54 dependent transcriptional regulator [Candidatus Omnitrophota bacterium]